MTGAEVLVRAAMERGIAVCFANTGTTEIPLIAALDKYPGIRAVPCLFEGVCTAAADGYGRVSGRPAMALLHLGPGLANGTAYLHNARRARAPLVNLIGEHASWHLPNDPPLAMDIEALAAVASDWKRTSAGPETLSRDMAEAVAAALRGCVSTLIVPNDFQLAEAPFLPAKTAETFFDPVSRDAIENAVRLLSSGRKTAVLLGGRALRLGGLNAAARVRAAAGCDLLCTSFPAFIERGGDLPGVRRIPYFPEAALDLLSPYEGVVFAGANEPVTFFGYPGIPGKLLREDQEKIFIWTEGQDEIASLEALADGLGAPQSPARPRGYPKAVDRSALPSGALTPEKVCMVLAALQPEDVIIVDEGLTSAFAYWDLSAGAPGHSLMSVSGGAIGYGMPCALGAALACPGKKVINLEADGSGLYTVQALWTQAREGVDVTTLVCSNRSYRIVEMELIRSGIDPGGTAAMALTHLSPPVVNWVALAKGFGVEASACSTAEDLAAGLSRALAEPGPHLIEMIL